MSDKEDALRVCPKLATSLHQFERYAALLEAWQSRINLVSSSTLPQLWTRHFADSAQLIDVMPKASRWIDLGSGAGFPGMVLAILLRDRPDAVVHLIESDQRKVGFLRAVSRETSAPAIIHCGRIEQELPTIDADVEAISARALAPLSALVDFSRERLMRGAQGVFLKGENWRSELTALGGESNFEYIEQTSRTNSAARIILVRCGEEAVTPV
jgi:16S rRNA (guanine527-N7)-methyltransferase